MAFGGVGLGRSVSRGGLRGEGSRVSVTPG